mmetsp:Transcript_12982/g.37619  ORF Transcript_12982/g.37619 Transcript_12982/m.37619 type:complete len:233 (-) Transcript_12982:836-1534(-)
MNGRLLDVYNRITGELAAFFIPFDAEISERQLRWICLKSRQWQGITGEARKINVTDYAIKDPEDPTFEEVTTHIAIFTVSKDKTRTLYRHFLKLPEGAILEMPPDRAHDAGLAPDSAFLQKMLGTTGDDGSPTRLSDRSVKTGSPTTRSRRQSRRESRASRIASRKESLAASRRPSEAPSRIGDERKASFAASQVDSEARRSSLKESGIHPDRPAERVVEIRQRSIDDTFDI